MLCIKVLPLFIVGSISMACISFVSGDETTTVPKEPVVKNMTDRDFKDETNSYQWRTVNDGVMGGRSEGDSYFTEAGNRMFTGEISLKNNEMARLLLKESSLLFYLLILQYLVGEGVSMLQPFR